MTYISKMNIYRNDKGIEIHEEELVSGKFPQGRTTYTAMVNVGVNVEGSDEPMSVPVNAKFHAIGIEEAFKKAEKELNKEVEKLQKRMQEDMEAAIEEARGPRIIAPG